MKDKKPKEKTDEIPRKPVTFYWEKEEDDSDSYHSPNAGECRIVNSAKVGKKEHE